MEVCDDGECLLECPVSKVACDGACVDANSDIYNCGGCGVTCSAGDNADPVCDGGICTVLCHAGWSDMDGDGSCETDCVPTSDVEICNGVDDNCDGETDEGFACRMGQEVSCTTTCGSIGTGTCGTDCEIPGPEACTPAGEICNGVDDNCDGDCDEDFGCCRGTTETGGCGNCGTHTRTCSSSCEWRAWGACTGEGECAAGSTQDCGNCGIQTCTSSCAWGICTGEGECTPGTTENRPCVDGCGNQTRQCSPGCEWGEWSSCDAPEVTITLTAYDGATRTMTDCEPVVFALDYPGSFAHNCPAARCRWDLSKGGVKAYYKSDSDCSSSAEGNYRPRGSCSTAAKDGNTVTCCAE